LALQEPTGVLHLVIESEAHAQAELRVVLEQRVRPRGAAAVRVLRPRRGRQVPAVDRGAPGGVRDQDAVPVHLGEQLQVRRLAASCARPAELEQRLEHLRALDRGDLDLTPVRRRDLEEEVERGALNIQVIGLGFHVDRLVLHDLLRTSRADVDADRAPGAVIGRDLDGHPLAGVLAVAPFLVLEAGGSSVDGRRIEDLHQDRCVRADQRAFRAVDADLRIPDRDLVGDGPPLPPGRIGWERAVHRKRRDREQVAAPGDHRGGHALYEVGGILGHRGQAVQVARDRGRDPDLPQSLQRRVHGGEVLLDDHAPPLPVGLLDGRLDALDGLGLVEHAGQREEAGLQDGVDSRAEAGRAGRPLRVDDEEPEALVDDLPLGLHGQVIPHVLRPERAVQQERRTRRRELEHVLALQEPELVAGDEVRGSRTDQVGRADLARSEPQVGHRHRAGLLGVVHEVPLREQVRALADDLDRALVGAHGAVGPEAVEHGAYDVGRLGRERAVDVQGRVGDVVGDAHREVALGLVLR